MIFAMALLAVLLSSFLAAAPASALTPPSGLGVNAQEMLWGLPTQDWAPNLSEMYADGIRTVRADAFWDRVEPSPPDASGHHYDFASTDTIVGALAYYGLRWQPIADYSAPWAASVSINGQPTIYSPPKNYDDYVQYASALIARYGAGGTFWAQNPTLAPKPITGIEVWNEPDGSYFWLPGPDPAAYARLYKATRQAVHAIDPSVEVMIGGISPGTDFLDSVYTALGGAGKIDAVGVHPYALDALQVGAGVARIRSVMDSHGDVNVPIDVTEFGWTTVGSSGVTDAQRAGLLTDAVTSLASSDCGVERILPHTWASPEADANNPEDWFGLASPDGTPHQSATALAQTYLSLDQTSDSTAPSAHATNPVCARPLSLSLTTASGTASAARAATRRAAKASKLSRGARGHTRRSQRSRRRRRHSVKHTQTKAITHAKQPSKSTQSSPGNQQPSATAVANSSLRCAGALVQSAGKPVSGAQVSFTFASGGRSLPGPGPAPTDINGVATACVKVSPDASVVVTAAAQSPSFVPVPTAKLSL